MQTATLKCLQRPTALSLALYVSLTLSTALQFTFGPEATLRLAGFYTTSSDTRDPEFRGWYPDFGSLRDDTAAYAALRHGDPWKFSTFWADAAYYVRQATHLHQSIAPYKYRFLPTAIVGVLALSTGLRVDHAFVVFNALVSVLTALLFEAYLRRAFGFSQLVSVLGGCLFVTSAGNTGTLAFPMLEPASALCSCLIFMAVCTRHTLGFVGAALAGVATKEILIFSTVLWLTHRPTHEPRWKAVVVAAVPVLAFVSIRVALGGSALEVNYSYDVLHGQFPAYGKRLLGLRSCLILLGQTFLAFSFLWIGLINAPKHPLLKRSLIVVPLVLLAAFLLSGRITRVIGVLFPIVVPSFLLFFDHATTSKNATANRPSPTAC